MNRYAFLVVLAAACGQVIGADLLPPEASPQETIDHYINARLAAENVQPAPLARDEVLIRRTTLDLAGRPATVAEVQAYLADQSPDKRQQLIARLIGSKEFVRHQTTELETLLMEGKGGLTSYLEAAVTENRPWDVIFRELLLAEDKTTAAFLKSRISDLDKLTNEASVLFFGVNVSCAKCHDHPLVPDWTQDRYYGMKSFFNRTFDHGDFVGEREYGTVDFKTTDGESRDASLMFFTGAVVPEPKVKEPDDAGKKAEKKTLEERKKKKLPAPRPSFSRRAQLVEVATQSENLPYLARAIVNRLWRRFYGLGLVHPVDQMHPENLPSHPELLEWLARDLIAHHFDLRRLCSALVSSDAYARTSRWEAAETRPAEHLFAVADVRPLAPRQYAAALRMGSTDPEHFAVEGEELEKRLEQLHSAARGLAGKFEPPRDDFQISVTEALLLSNDAQLERDLLRTGGDSLVSRLMALETPQQRAETAVWAVLGQAPDPQQHEAITQYLKQREPRAEEGIKQIVWALLCSSSVRFNY